MGHISVFAGAGHGKTPAAIGEALMRAAMGDQVVIIQFLKGKGLIDSKILTRLEPEIKIFRFEKSQNSFDNLSREEQEEEVLNIKNGLHFAKKVLSTGECDLLVLDEVMGIIDNGILSVDELCGMLSSRADSMDVILTGITVDEKIAGMADAISTIS